MPSRIVYHRAGTISADGQWELDALDLSWADLLRISIKLTGNSGGTTPTLNVYLQSRGAFGLWNDRAAFPQLVDADNSGEAWVLNLSKFGDLSDTEEGYEPTGSSGGSRLSPGANGVVRNGPFPGNYRNKGVGIETAWRFDFDVGGTEPTWPLEIWIEADAAA